MNRKHNFGAGPGILPVEVLKEASEAVLEFNNLGMSLLEVSHRGKHFIAVMDEARQLVKDLFNLHADYEVMFLQGGASLQFLMVPYNLLSTKGTAAYINTGTWAKKAIKEAKLIGNVNVLATSEDKNFNYIPKNVNIPSDVDYLHITSNNTIFGTQYKTFPNTNVPLIADMSSDIFSKKIVTTKFSLIYAGAQKNMGPAGTTLVIVKKDLLGKTGRTIPSMLDYNIHIENDSMFNTPPVFAVYVSMLTLRWIKNNGGLETMEKRNREKAEIIYRELDENPLFYGTAEKEDRSDMNVTFLLKDNSLDEEFLNITKGEGISGLKGHRSVGGFRASIYNAMPVESVKTLVEVMQEFAMKHA
jgi:phosphoserine aminotransferase